MSTTISNIIPSDFVVGQHVSSSNLRQFDVLRVCWAPDRCCHFRHLGGGRFVVEHSENSKLAVGDTFSCLIFVPGQPLYLDDVFHQGQGPMLYEAGRQGGLQEVTLLDGDTMADPIVHPQVEECLRHTFPQRPFGLTEEGLKHDCVPLAVALSNALRCGLIKLVGCQLVFSAQCPEVECGYFVHQLKSHYTFSSWAEIETLLKRQKPDGTFVKSLRQLRSFGPKPGNPREAELAHLIFGRR